MKLLSCGWRILAVVATLTVACSSRDQTLGETRRAPSPSPVPTPSLQPAPAPLPEPPPQPNNSACEDAQRHARVGHCVDVGTCFGQPITSAGYECPAGQI